MLTKADGATQPERRQLATAHPPQNGLGGNAEHVGDLAGGEEPAAHDVGPLRTRSHSRQEGLSFGHQGATSAECVRGCGGVTSRPQSV